MDLSTSWEDINTGRASNVVKARGHLPGAQRHGGEHPATRVEWEVAETATHLTESRHGGISQSTWRKLLCFSFVQSSHKHAGSWVTTAMPSTKADAPPKSAVLRTFVEHAALLLREVRDRRRGPLGPFRAALRAVIRAIPPERPSPC
jgi:hypothetical protein